MRRILRPFPWALLGHLCLGIVLAPLLAILLGLTAVALPLAVFTPRPFLSLVRGLGSLAGLDRARFDVLARRHVASRCPPRRHDQQGRLTPAGPLVRLAAAGEG